MLIKVVNNVDNISKTSKNQDSSNINSVDNSENEESSIVKEEVEIMKLKSNQSINESNLMTLPFISLNKSKVKILQRYWEVNGVMRGLTCKGSADNGCPTIAELDVLLALFKILTKNIDYKYEYNRATKTASFPRTIHFTYQELSNELGYKYYGGSIKKKLEKSIKTLIETTIYSDFALYDISNKDYVDEFKGEQSFRILTNYRAYSYTRKKKKGEKLDNAKVIKERQSVDIDDFFFNSISNNYFKIYDYSKYMKLTKGFSKKIYLMLTQWSRGFEKIIKYDTIYDYLALDTGEGENEVVDEVKTAQKKYYYNKLIKESLDELEKVGFIQGYEINKSKGINVLFDKKQKSLAYGRKNYTSAEEIITRLQEIGFSLDEWTKYYRLDNEDYIRALLRHVDYRLSKGDKITNIYQYMKKGLIREDYDVAQFY